jgi:hypothetical protein
MDVDAAPRQRTIPIWAWLLGATALLYLALWGGTYILAARQVRKYRAWEKSHHDGVVVLLPSFDPSLPPPSLQPDDPNDYYFIGNVWCPCPLVAFHEVAAYNSKRGGALRLREYWQGKDWKEIEARFYWSY